MSLRGFDFLLLFVDDQFREVIFVMFKLLECLDAGCRHLAVDYVFEFEDTKSNGFHNDHGSRDSLNFVNHAAKDVEHIPQLIEPLTHISQHCFREASFDRG